MAKGEVRYRLVLDSSGFQSGLKAAGQAAQSFGNDLAGKLGKAGDVLSSMGPAGMVAAAGIGAATVAIGAVTAAVVSATKGAAEYADNLAALETKTGLSTDALQKMEVAAKLGNTSIEALASATNKMQKGIVDGNENFRKLGLSLSDLKKMTPEEQLKATAVAIERIQNPAQKTAAAIAIFGKSGTDSLGALKALAEGAGDLGGALDSKAIKSSAEMADKLDLMGTAMERAWLQFGAAIASSPEVQAAIEDITKALVDAAGWMQKHGPEIKAFFGMIAEYARAAMNVVKELGGWLSKLAPDAMGGEFYRDKLKAARMGTGVSSGGVEIMRKVGGRMVPDGPQFTGAADDKAARDAARAEMERIEAVKKARIEEHKTRLKMQDEIDKRQTASLQRELKEMGEAAREKADLAKAAEAAQMEQDLLDQAAKEAGEQFLADKAEEEFQKIQRGLQDIASEAIAMGQVFGGVFGKIVQSAGAAIGAFGQMRASLASIKSAGGGLGGILQKASGAMGMVGAGIQAFSMIKSLFGGKSKEQLKAEADARKELQKMGVGGTAKLDIEQLEKLKDTVGKLQSAMDKIDALKMEKLKSGVGGVAALFKHMGSLAALTDKQMGAINDKMAKYKKNLIESGLEGEKLDKALKQKRRELESGAEGADLPEMQARMNRLGLIATGMFMALKKQGMSTVDAMQEMGPAIDQAIEAAKAHGVEIGGTLGMLADFRAKVGANEGLVSAVDGLASAMDALRSTGNLTQETFAALQAEAGDLFNEMTAKGFTADQALALLAPTLMQIRDAAKDGRVQVDATTASLIQQAEAGGHFEGLKDPMEELVEVQKAMLELWAAIAQMQGVTLPASLREYIATLHQAQSAQSGLGSGGGGVQNKYGGEDIAYPETPGEAGHGASGYHGILGRGPLPGGGTPLVGHPGEEAYLGPPGGNSGITGGMLSMTTILRINETELGRAQTGMLRKNKGGVSSGTARYGARG